MKILEVLEELWGDVGPEKNWETDAVRHITDAPDQCQGCGIEMASEDSNLSDFCPECKADGTADSECEAIYVDADGEVLNEAAVRMFKRVGKEIKRKYRCTTGPKKGKPVSDPKKCATRIDPKKKRLGRKVARTRKGIRVRKTKIAKRTSMSRMVARMNARLKGGRSSGAKKVTRKKVKYTKSPSTKHTLKPSSTTLKPVKTK